MQGNNVQDEIEIMFASMDEEQGEREEIHPTDKEPEAEPTEAAEIQDVYVLIVRERDTEKEDLREDAIETTLTARKTQTIEPLDPGMVATGIFYLFLVTSCIALQIFLLLNPPTATVTIFPKSQSISVNQTLQIGRVLSPLTLNQSQTVPTTGKGHLDARQAQGTITLYNGQLKAVNVPAGTVFTSFHGVQIVTNEDASLPSASPPTEGQTTVTAHAVTSGSAGNISARDINEACCATAVLAVNLTPFQGGQNERNFQTVTKSDIDRTAQALKVTLTQSMQGALTGQLTAGEALISPNCTPTTAADHQPGDEAGTVKVTVSLTCSGIAYNRKILETRAMQLLTTQAQKRLGSGYSLIGTIQISVSQANLMHNTPTLVLSSQGVWVYAISDREQKRMKSLITGKTKKEALQMLRSLAGIEKFSIAWDENTRLPKDPHYIHFVVIFATE